MTNRLGEYKLSKIFLYAHGGCANHGCEALVRSTIKIIGCDDITLISSRPEEDKQYGIDKLCKIIKETNESFSKRSMSFLKAYAALKLKQDYLPMEKLRYKNAFDCVKKGDIAISIGGDNYCYADVEKYIMMHDMLKERGAKTVLWGCSIEPKVVSRKDVSKDLAKYDLITARETITYEAVKSVNPHTILVSDPAFQLDYNPIELPREFVEGNTVGINLSPMVIENETVKGVTWDNYIHLIEYIINETDMNIAFIPHVVWNESDDRVPLEKLYNLYKNSKRVCLISDNSCTKLKYVISKCRFFIGARTHSTIAAYSTGIPTLVLGYSVKAIGIARDLFQDERNYVINVQELNQKDEILIKYKWIQNHEKEIKDLLLSRISDYKQKGIVAIN